MHQIQHSPLSHPTYSNQASKQSINIQSIMLRSRSPPPPPPDCFDPTGGFGESGEDGREMTCCPSASRRIRSIQSLTTTRTSNCDYSFLLYTSPIPYTSLRQQPRPCATSLEQTRLTRLRRRQLSCNVVSRPSCANREPTPSTCMLRYLSSLCYHSTRHYLPCRLVSR